MSLYIIAADAEPINEDVIDVGEVEGPEDICETEQASLFNIPQLTMSDVVSRFVTKHDLTFSCTHDLLSLLRSTSNQGPIDTPLTVESLLKKSGVYKKKVNLFCPCLSTKIQINVCVFHTGNYFLNRGYM